MAVVDSTQHVPRPSRLAGYADVAQAITGAGLVIFMISHAFFVATKILGTNVYDGLAHFFEATYLTQLGAPIVVIGFFLHFLLAVRKIPFRIAEQKTMWQHSGMLGHLDTWGWVIQATTAMIVLVLGATHMWVVLSDLPIEAREGAERIANGFWLLFYLLLLPTIWLHTGVGAYRVMVKWGFVTRKNRRQVRHYIFYGIGFFILLGLVSIIRFATMTY